MMWIPGKAAFRVGDVTGNQWDTINIGNDSVAFGRDTVASGMFSAAFGWNSVASGTNSFAVGNASRATRHNAISMGYNTLAEGLEAMALGASIEVYANNSVGIGLTTTWPYYEVRQNNTMAIMGGKVGISTTSPQNILTLQNNSNTDPDGLSIFNSQGQITVGLADYRMSTYNFGVLALYDPAVSTTYPNTFITGFNNGWSFFGGRVGIGTSTPETTLSVAGNSTMRHIYPSMIGASGYVSVYDLGASDKRWRALWAETLNIGTSTWSIKQNGSRLSFYDAAGGGGTERLTILDNGNMGIGTTNPLAKLNVDGGGSSNPWVTFEGGASVLENIALRLYDKGTAANNVNILEFAHNTSTGPAGVARIKSTNLSNNASTGGKLIFETASDNTGTWNSNQLVLNNNGNVGIGTTTPRSVLHVEGTISTVSTTGILSFAANRIFDSFRGHYILTDSALGEHLPIVFRTAGVNRMTIMTSTGYVGIGTTSPQSLLEVSGNTSELRISDYRNSGVALLRFMRGTSTTFGGDVYSDWEIRSTGGDLLFTNSRSELSTTSLTLDSEGLVGIGTTVPLTKLHLAGDGAILATGTSYSGWSGGALGAGVRLMWIPYKAAFRAGEASSTQWDSTNIGQYSAAFNRWNLSLIHI